MFILFHLRRRQIQRRRRTENLPISIPCWQSPTLLSQNGNFFQSVSIYTFATAIVKSYLQHQRLSAQPWHALEIWQRCKLCQRGAHRSQLIPQSLSRDTVRGSKGAADFVQQALC